MGVRTWSGTDSFIVYGLPWSLGEDGALFGAVAGEQLLAGGGSGRVVATRTQLRAVVFLLGACGRNFEGIFGLVFGQQAVALLIHLLEIISIRGEVQVPGPGAIEAFHREGNLSLGLIVMLRVWFWKML